MNFKNGQDEIDWHKNPAPEALQLFAYMLDHYRDDMLGDGDITITSFRRIATTKPSYHPKGHAIDIRTHNMSPLIRKMVLSYARNIAGIMNNEALQVGFKIDVVAHNELLGTPNAHIHIEYDDGNPVSI